MIKEAVFGAGCFWCYEPSYNALRGVLKAIPGYAGGETHHPTYEQVCTGKTGHTEVVHIEYDDTLISYEELLEVFWKIHDPTQLNRQGNDVGTQYRSVIFYYDDQQKEIAERLLKELDASETWSQPIVTAIEPIYNFFPAEDYHKDYARLHPENQYCMLVSRPKFEKFKAIFADKLKEK